MIWCRVPEICERFKIDFGIYDGKSKGILPRTLKERSTRLYVHKNNYCVLWEKIEETRYLMQ